MICRRAPSCILICLDVVWESQPALAVQSILFEVIVCWILVVSTLPPESCPVILTVQRQTFSNFTLLVWIRSIPAVMSNRALVTVAALLIRSFQLCACTLPRPGCCLSTEHLSAAIRVLVTKLSLSEPSADTILTVLRNALLRNIAGASIVEHNIKAWKCQAVGLRSFLVNLRILYWFLALISNHTYLLGGFVDPSPFIRE